MIKGFNGKIPKIDKSAFVSEAAYVVGDVEIGENSSWRPRGDSNPNVQYIAYLLEILCPPRARLIISHYKLPATFWSELAMHHKTSSLWELAKEYGVSHESVRRSLATGNLQNDSTLYRIRGSL
jgi:hypothetical protein